MKANTTTTKLLNQLMKKENIKNDCQLAKHLNVTPTAIYRYRDGQSMDYTIAIKVCKSLNIEKEPVLAKITADREINSDTKKIWYEIAKKLELACYVLCSGIILTLLPATAEASTVYVNTARSIDCTIMYIMLNCVLLFRRRWSLWKERFNKLTSVYFPVCVNCR